MSTFLFRSLLVSIALARAAFAQCATWDSNFSSAGVNGNVFAFQVFDDGSGPALFAGGTFWMAGGTTVNYIAKWDGHGWSAIGGGLNSYASSLAVYDDGTGPALYAGGYFTVAGGVSASRIAKWDGTSWSPLASGMDDAVLSLEVFDDGSGPALYAGGVFSTAGGASASKIARWNGASWSPLASGMDDVVQSLEVFDDGSGAALYAGGRFAVAGGTAANRIAKWNGIRWSALSSGMGGWFSSVRTLRVFDDGSGLELYAGGSFQTAGLTRASSVAKWNGTNWSALAAGVNGGVYALQVFDDGSGAALFAGGDFTAAGGTGANRVAKWNGTSWTALGSGINSYVSALAAYDDGLDGDADLYVGGGFSTAGSQPSIGIAEWHGCGTLTFCFGDGSIAPCPCANNGLAGHGCDNSSTSGGALLTVSGVASLAMDSVLFHASGEKPTALSVLTQGQTQTSAVVFGQGLRCVAGQMTRLDVEHAANGAFSAPTGAEPKVHARSAAAGDTITAGSSRYYFAYYRDATVLGGCPSTSTFNSTQSLRLIWSP
jgi:hypothetical protein